MNIVIRILALISYLIALSDYSIAQENIYDITNFGAKSNSESLSTKPIHCTLQDDFIIPCPKFGTN